MALDCGSDRDAAAAISSYYKDFLISTQDGLTTSCRLAVTECPRGSLVVCVMPDGWSFGGWPPCRPELTDDKHLDEITEILYCSLANSPPFHYELAGDEACDVLTEGEVLDGKSWPVSGLVVADTVALKSTQPQAGLVPFLPGYRWFPRRSNSITSSLRPPS